MRLLILGAGAIGGYFGGRLLEAGADVTFLVRPNRAAQLVRDGLVVRSTAGDVRIRPAPFIVAGEATAQHFDLVLLACKAYDLESAIDAVRPAVAAGACVLPLLNGIAHLDVLDGVFGGDRTLGGLCHIGVTLDTNGAIEHLSPFHRIVFGARLPAQEAICAGLERTMTGVRFDARHSSDIIQEMWEKFVFLATLAGMTCLMRAPIGAIVAASDGAALMLEMLDECVAVAGAAGHAPGAEYLRRSRLSLTEPGSSQTSSMLRDIERRSPRIEAAHIIGDMLARARAARVEAPLLRIANAHLQSYLARLDTGG
jgi:2-dehydropantoate 2-reductase